jgi:mono/diheme cytochrome c family protein
MHLIAPFTYQGANAPRSPAHFFLRAYLVVLLLVVQAGCDRLDMYDQPRYEPLEASDFFSDGLSARPPVPGTIPRGGLRDDEAYFTGKEASQFVSEFPAAAYRAMYERTPQKFDRPYDEIEPAELRRAVLERGQERFNIHCAVCHGRTGEGDGMIVLRGFRRPPSYHTDRLRQAPAGHFYDVMTNGFGAMASYAGRVEVADRWAIVAYIRALQLSHNASLDDVPADQADLLGSVLKKGDRHLAAVFFEDSAVSSEPVPVFQRSARSPPDAAASRNREAP